MIKTIVLSLLVAIGMVSQANAQGMNYPAVQTKVMNAMTAMTQYNTTFINYDAKWNQLYNICVMIDNGSYAYVSPAKLEAFQAATDSMCATIQAGQLIANVAALDYTGAVSDLNYANAVFFVNRPLADQKAASASTKATNAKTEYNDAATAVSLSQTDFDNAMDIFLTFGWDLPAA